MMLRVFEIQESTVVSRQERNASPIEQEPNHGNRVFHRVRIQVKGMKKSQRGMFSKADCMRMRTYARESIVAMKNPTWLPTPEEPTINALLRLMNLTLHAKRLITCIPHVMDGEDGTYD